MCRSTVKGGEVAQWAAHVKQVKVLIKTQTGKQRVAKKRMFKAAPFFSLSILLILSHSLTIYPSLSYPHAQWKYYSWPGACDCASWCARRPPNSTRAASSRWRFTMSSCSPASSMCPCELPHTLYRCTVYNCISLCTQVVSAVTRQSGSAVHHILLPHAADSDAAAGAHLRQQGACSAPDWE